jgi:hypothetical protein
MATLAATGTAIGYSGWRRSIARLHQTEETPFAALLPPGIWEELPAAVRRRFQRHATAGAAITYAGEVVECRMSTAGWLLAQAARLIGAPLPLGRDTGVPATVCITEDRAGRGQHWSRQYGRAAGFPQVIQSAKRFAGPTGLEEYLGHGIGIALRLATEADALLFVGDHYFLRVAGLRLRWPDWLAPGQLVIRHQDIGGDRFVFALDLIHPLFGEMIHQVALFADPIEPR